MVILRLRYVNGPDCAEVGSGRRNVGIVDPISNAALSSRFSNETDRNFAASEQRNRARPAYELSSGFSAQRSIET
jgi:hypothetical protein